MFQSYQFRQINPDLFSRLLENISELVSIVSIQADQSRPNVTILGNEDKTFVSIVSIQADQSRQLPLGSQSWRGSQRLNGGTYFFNRKMIKIYTVNLYKI